MSKTPAPPQPTGPTGPIRVRATKEGFYGGQRIRVGKTFMLASHTEFTARWMARVDQATPDDIAKTYSPRKKRPGEQHADEEPASNVTTSTRRSGTPSDDGGI